jgi:hypothetical protein
MLPTCLEIFSESCFCWGWGSTYQRTEPLQKAIWVDRFELCIHGRFKLKQHMSSASRSAWEHVTGALTQGQPGHVHPLLLLRRVLTDSVLC